MTITAARAGVAYGKLPLSFEANRGQAARPVQFLSHGRGYTLFLSATEASLSLSGSHGSPGKASTHPSVRMRLIGSNPAARLVGLDPLPGKSNYFIGRDPRSWHLDVPHYAKVGYRAAYPGIDLVFYGDEQGRLEHDFVVAPGADPAAIRLAFEGVDRLELDPRGDLVLRPSVGEQRDAIPAERVVRLLRPRIHQETRGGRSEIPGRFVVESRPSGGRSSRQVRFAIGAYDRRRPLVIDPVLVYSTYLGGPGDFTYLPTGIDQATAIAVDNLGNAYVTGSTDSAWFPATNPMNPEIGGVAFVTKFNPEGSALVYSDFIGGYSEWITGIAVDGQGSAYLTGMTGSDVFPTTPGAFQTVPGDINDAFVTKLSPEGNALVYSTYLGGSTTDYGSGIAVDGMGNAFVTGVTHSSDFPVTPAAVQTAFQGDRDAFVTKLNPVGSALVYSTYLGGSSADGGNGIAVDGLGSAYLAGWTNSSDFPVTPGAFAPAYGGEWDGFVAKLSPEGTASLYSTYLGGSSPDNVTGVAVDAAGHAYLTGNTFSSDFPVTPGAFQPALGGQSDAFVTKLNPEGTAPVYSTYLGGDDSDGGAGIAIDASGRAYVAGYTRGSAFPTVDAIQAANGGDVDAFVTKLDAEGTALVYSTHLGGAGPDGAVGIAVDSAGDAYVMGSTQSFDLPVTPGSFQLGPALTTDGMCCGNGPFVYDTFVARIGAAASPGLALAPAAASFATERLGSTSPPREIRLLAAGSEPLGITSIEASGDFAQTNTCGSAVSPGATCTITVSFTPTAIGARSGAITIADNAPGAPHVIPLDGEAIDPQIALVPASLTFASQEIGTTSDALTVALSNSGTSPLYVDSIQTTGDFVQTNTCGWVVAPGATCAISVRFAPKYPGTRTGYVYVDDNAAGSPHLVPLTGTATGDVPIVALSPDRLAYGYQPLGTTSPPQTVTLSNSGTSALTISSMVIWGNFFQNNNCGSTVAAGAGCTINIVFRPTFDGIQTGTVTITDNAPGSPHVINLRGNDSALWVGISPASLTFAGQAVGTTSAPQAVTYSNLGYVPTAVASIVASGDFAQTSNCGSSVAVGAGCTISVTFAPTAPGSRSGALTITDNAFGTPHVVPLGGTGIAVNVPPTASFTSACSGLTCSFNGSASTDSDGTITSWAWSFGDGITGSGAVPNHTYAAAGTHTVTLTVTDNVGATGAQSQVVTVVNNPPVALFIFTCSGLNCSFDGSGSADSDGTIASYAWAFGDGTTASGAVVSHAYSVPGAYTTTLTVTDSGGATGTRSHAVVVASSHVGDLDGAVTSQGGSWTAVVTITIHEASHAIVAGAGVSGSWTGGSTGSCTTNGAGQCTVSRSSIPNGTNAATFTVAGVTHPSLTYRPADNHDPDGDSSGSSITISRR